MPNLFTDVVPAPEKRISLQNSAVTSAIRVIIHLILLVGCVVSNLMTLDFNQVPFLGPAQNGLTQHISHHVGE